MTEVNCAIKNKQTKLLVSGCPRHDVGGQMCCRCVEIIQFWVPPADSCNLLLHWCSGLSQREMRISGSAGGLWFYLQDQTFDLVIGWKRGRSYHQTGTFKSAFSNFNEKNPSAVHAFITLLTALRCRDAADASVKGCTTPNPVLKNKVFTAFELRFASCFNPVSFLLSEWTRTPVRPPASQLSRFRNNKYTVIICTDKRPSRFCRASVSHVARLFFLLLLTAPDQGKGGGEGPQRSGQRRDCPTAPQRKRRNLPDGETAADWVRSLAVGCCFPRPSPARPTVGGRPPPTKRALSACVSFLAVYLRAD